ncbi:MAG: CCA tRNA nucleotidyltransferase, partial [Candidatus Margulisiibacteriota bacterium]
KFTAKGYEIYLVGGGVKSLLQNQNPPLDCDFTTNATPQETQLLFPNSFYDNIFGTVGIPVETPQGKGKIEITTYRSEWGYSDHRRPDKIRWGTKLEEDLKRRDFTFNAVVIGPLLKNSKWDGKSLEIIDLFGGIRDFKNKIIRAVGDPKERFAEDALRMMRAVRFAAQLGFVIEEKTFAAIQKNASLINQISKERIREELFKVLSSGYPADGYQLLRNCGLAQVILPEVEKMFGVEQKSPGRHHQDDVGTHALKSLKATRSSDPIVNLAILLHDVGKPVVASKDQNGTITFYNHEVVGASIAKNIAHRLRLSKKDTERLFRLVRWHQFTVDERQTDKAIRRFIRNVGSQNLTDILELRRADRVGGGARETSWRLEKFKAKLAEVQKQPFTVNDLKVDGYDVMKTLNISPGPLVGKVLNQLFEEVVEDKSKNERKYLLKRIKQIGKSLVSG